MVEVISLSHLGLLMGMVQLIQEGLLTIMVNSHLVRLANTVKKISLVILVVLCVALTGCHDKAKKGDAHGCYKFGCCSACRIPGVACDCDKCPCVGDGCPCCSHCPGSTNKEKPGCCGSK